MFVSSVPTEKRFEPCSITLETMDEVEMIYAMLNFTPIVEALPDLPADIIRENLQNIYDNQVDSHRHFHSLNTFWKNWRG